MKKIKVICLVSLMVLTTVFSNRQIFANDQYRVVLYNDNGSIVQEIASYSNFNEANNRRLSSNQNQNYAVVRNNEILAINYGVVNFNTSDLAYTNTYDIRSVTTGVTGYFTGAYAADAPFIDGDGSTIKFQLAGDVFTTAMQQNGLKVSILPYRNNLGLSKYRAENNELRHYISTNVNQRVAFSNPLAPAPNFMNSNVDYYSYDGHYFYTDYKAMIRDLRSNVKNNAINSTPYYVYYQFLPHRTRTNYTVSEFNDWFYNVMEYQKPVSNRYGSNLVSKLNTTDKAFIDAQNRYGANALLIYGLSRNESADGYSQIAQDKLNLFGHNAYDSSAYASASGYDTNSASVYHHAQSFVSEIYSHVGGWAYSGSHGGDKASGMNVRYASDPYWGEKMAANYYKFDVHYGLKDFNYYTIGIQKDNQEVLVYANPGDSKAIFSLKSYLNRPFALLTELTVNNETWYKINPDTPLNATRSDMEPYRPYRGQYDFNTQVAYIKASDLKIVITSKNGMSTDKEGWHYDKTTGDYYFYDDKGIMQKDKWINGAYVKSDGRMAKNEWIYDNNYQSYYYLLDNGYYATNRWAGDYYLKADGKMAKNEWINDTFHQGTYYLDSNGKYVKNRWINGRYLKDDGRMAVKEWIYDNNYQSYYYLLDSGYYATNRWAGDYYLKADGKMAKNEWINDTFHQGTYYLDSNGKYVKNRWINGRYLKDDGRMAVKEWIYDNNYQSYYYLLDSGYYATSRWIGDYYLKADGKMAKNEWVYDTNYQAYYYVDNSGAYVKNRWAGDYYLGADGKMLKNTITPDGYRLDENGKKIGD